MHIHFWPACALCAFLVPVEVRRRHQISQELKFQMVMNYYVSDGNRAQFCKSNKCSFPQSHFSSAFVLI